ncbi:MAG: glycoside hydrolase family 15 protein [Nitrococcus sp.]|nr:glycoside hydrolase family 15 protein [Nitrococcus sp.]
MHAFGGPSDSRAFWASRAEQNRKEKTRSSPISARYPRPDGENQAKHSRNEDACGQEAGHGDEFQGFIPVRSLIVLPVRAHALLPVTVVMIADPHQNVEEEMAYAPIEDYGIIGDLHTVALVGRNGSIDFMCFPQFDSPTIFAALLDDQKGGRFAITPDLDHARTKQLYLPDTNILLTRFLSPDGVVEISDFMPVDQERRAHALIRRAKVVRGQVRFRMLCAPRFDYARAAHRVEREGDTWIFASEGADQTRLRLCSDLPIKMEDQDGVCEFKLKAGETAAFVLEEVREGLAPCRIDCSFVSSHFKTTSDYWRAWVHRSNYRGRWREVVNRSALALKLLTSSRHGSIVAAPTFGLPEVIGGERNWDYRFTWIRDASFTLYALIRLGYTSETHGFMRWLEERCKDMEPNGALQTMYGIDGRHELRETTLDHLEGYRGSRPVRIGNAAHSQLQLDIYGELMDSLYMYDKYGSPIGYETWQNILRLISWLEGNWDRPDEGIWEVRGGQQEFLFSRLMCWIALDRGIRLSRKRGLPAPVVQWKQTRDRIYQDIFENFWSDKKRSFVQMKGSEALDASALLMPLVKFVSPTDERWRQTMEAIERELMDDSLVYRYREGQAASDGLTGVEGTFSMCSFWFVEALSRSGDLPKARFYFEKMLGYANHLGLYAEEIGPSGEHLGNFPQAFTHVALISAAYDLDRRLDAAHLD